MMAQHRFTGIRRRNVNRLPPSGGGAAGSYGSQNFVRIIGFGRIITFRIKIAGYWHRAPDMRKRGIFTPQQIRFELCCDTYFVLPPAVRRLLVGCHPARSIFALVCCQPGRWGPFGMLAAHGVGESPTCTLRTGLVIPSAAEARIPACGAITWPMACSVSYTHLTQPTKRIV